MRFEMSIDARGGTAHWQKLDLGETWDVNWYNMRDNCSPSFRFGWDLRYQLIQDEGLIIADQNIDLDETWVVNCYKMRYQFTSQVSSKSKF